MKKLLARLATLLGGCCWMVRKEGSGMVGESRYLLLFVLVPVARVIAQFSCIDMYRVQGFPRIPTDCHCFPTVSKSQGSHSLLPTYCSL
jgi:hypothetical protein